MNPPGGLESIELWQANIEQDQIRFQLLRFLDRSNPSAASPMTCKKPLFTSVEQMSCRKGSNLLPPEHGAEAFGEYVPSAGHRPPHERGEFFRYSQP